MSSERKSAAREFAQLRRSERKLWEEVPAARDALGRLARCRDLLDAYERATCATCMGIGSVPGFWRGTIKTCPACKGTGRQTA